MTTKSITIDPSLCEDIRTKQEIEYQRKLVKSICKENDAAFQLLVQHALEQRSSQKDSREKHPQVIQRMDLSHGRYLFYADTNNSNNCDNQSPSLPVVLTIHGVPGSPKDFLELQRETQSRIACRWITFLTPGLDRTDERRGNYRGYLEETAQLLNDFLTKLGVQQRVIVIMHSGGGMYAKNFACMYPQRVRALVQLAAIGINRWRPIQIETAIFNAVDADVDTLTREEVDSEAFRSRFAEDIFKYIDGMSINDPALQKGLALFKGLHISDHMMLLKAQIGTFAGGFDEFFSTCRSKLHSVPRFFAYSSIDNLLDETHIQYEIHETLLAKQALLRKLQKQIISSDPVFSKLKDRANMMSTYVFEYSDAGHAIQHVKAFDISIKLAHFISSLPLFEAAELKQFEQPTAKL